MTRLLITVFLAAVGALSMMGQTPVATENDIFSGTVTAAASDKVTVVRKVPAKADEFREFAVDGDTKVEGKLAVNARVTVRFKAADDGVFHALRIIVRADKKAPAGRAPSPKK